MKSNTNLLEKTPEAMTELKAKPVVKNKFWIVEREGEKVATIQTTSDGIVWVDGYVREKFATIKMLKDRYKVDFIKPEKQTYDANTVYGYPVTGRHFNELYDVSRRLPIYTKQERSKSYYCAGYYLIQLGTSWTKQYCPKLITLQRYEFRGPWKSEEQQQEALRATHGQ